jgi:hypothetical protein
VCSAMYLATKASSRLSGEKQHPVALSACKRARKCKMRWGLPHVRLGVKDVFFAIATAFSYVLMTAAQAIKSETQKANLEIQMWSSRSSEEKGPCLCLTAQALSRGFRRRAAGGPRPLRAPGFFNLSRCAIKLV